MITKKHTATLLILMLVGLTGLVNAQMSTTIKVQVPFDFVANSKTMPAGECIITVLGSGRPMLSISSRKQHVLALPIADESPNADRDTVLVFHRYGSRYFLASIKLAGGTGYELLVSKPENELRAQNADEESFTLLASAE